MKKATRRNDSYYGDILSVNSGAEFSARLSLMAKLPITVTLKYAS
jgi:hypothetical protein